MGNMSYCRFQNTLEDLRDCLYHINDKDLSIEEEIARDKLVIISQQIVEQFGSDEFDEDDLLNIIDY